MKVQIVEEEWRPVSRTDGQYEVSNLGRVRSLKCHKVRIMPQTTQRTGYHAFMVHIDRKSQCRKVHREVALAFIPNPEHLPEVNHIDGNKHNNKVSNLEWVTHQANVQHSFDIGIKTPHRWTDDERKMISDKVRATMRARFPRGTVL